MQKGAVEVCDGADASRWSSCEWSRPAFGPQAASGWRLIRRPVGPLPSIQESLHNQPR